MKYHTKVGKVALKFLVYVKYHTKASKVTHKAPRLYEKTYKIM